MASGESLLRQRNVYEQDGVFPPGAIDSIASQLKRFDDKGLSERFSGKGHEIKKLVEEYLHYSKSRRGSETCKGGDFQWHNSLLVNGSLDQSSVGSTESFH